MIAIFDLLFMLKVRLSEPGGKCDYLFLFGLILTGLKKGLLI